MQARLHKPIRFPPGTKVRSRNPSPISSPAPRRKPVPTFVPAEQRIATFDNDGTLW
jgi:hypothetical protein